MANAITVKVGFVAPLVYCIACIAEDRQIPANKLDGFILQVQA